MPMSPRLLRPIASGVHPEAAAWRSAVVANGGSVSASTMNAVSDFCAAIDAAGIRDRFYRLNLFCGDSDASLNAVRTPLYRGPSRTGTQYGNALDTNNNFVQGDYTETGSGGGLTGNGSSKYLDTGLSPDDSDAATGFHLAVYQPLDSNPAATRDWIGAMNVGATQRFYIRSTNIGLQAIIGGTTNFGASLPSAKGLLLIQRDASTASGRYDNGTLRNSTGGTLTPGSNTFGIYVFNSSNAGAPSAAYHNDRLISYSIGKGMTDTQNATYSTIMEAFQTTLGRNV